MADYDEPVGGGGGDSSRSASVSVPNHLLSFGGKGCPTVTHPLLCTALVLEREYSTILYYSTVMSSVLPTPYLSTVLYSTARRNFFASHNQA